MSKKRPLKRYLIIIATVILLTIVWHFMSVARPWDISIPVPKDQRNKPDYEFQDVRISDISGAAIAYSIKAQALAIDKTKAKMTVVSGSFFDGKKPSFTFNSTAAELLLSQQTAILYVLKGQSTGKNPWHVQGDIATWYQQRNTIEMPRKPLLWAEAITINADSMIYYIPYQFFILDKNCQITMPEFTVNCQKVTVKEKNKTIWLENDVYLEGFNIQARSDAAEIKYMQRTIELTRNVVVQSQGVALTAGTVFVSPTSNQVELKHNVVLSYKDILIESDRVVLDKNKKIIDFYENTRAYKNKVEVQSSQMRFDLVNKEFISSATQNSRTRIIKNNND